MAKLEDIVANSPVGMLIIDRATGLATYANPVAEKLLGIHIPPQTTLATLREKLDVVDTDGLPIEVSQFASFQARESGQVAGRVSGIRHPDGRITWLKVVALPINGSIVTHLTDITQEVEADLVRRQFEANVSHELRTPIALIMGFADQLVSHYSDLTQEQIQMFLRIIYNKAKDITWLLNNVLLVFKVEHHQNPGHFAPTDVAECVTETAESMTLMAQANNVLFTHYTEPGLCVNGSAVELRLMLNNLIMNAIKFSPGGQVAVTATAQNGEVVICVKDTGIGMSASTLAIIFEPFRQGDGSDTRQFGGTGIGLYVVNLLVKRHNGRIEVESKPGEGSTFTVYLPLLGVDHG